MDNQTNNQPQATPEKIAQAKDLLSRAGLTSPATRLMSETIIASKSDAAITELITGLNEMISEKEAAYQEFKTKMATMAKEMLPASPTMAAPVQASATLPPAAPVVDITPPGSTPTL